MLGFGTELNHYWHSLIRIVYPASCVLCRIPLILEETYLCVPCFQKIEPLKNPACFKCARPLPPYGNHSICSPCRSERPAYDRGFALVPYQEAVRDIFHQIKFQKKIWLLKVFRKLFHRFQFSVEMKNYEAIIPVPLDSRREWERGFNQALIIARMLNRLGENNEPLIHNVLRKKKKTLPQSQLRRQERLSNLEDAFYLRKKNAVRGKRVLLVDDIFTTGSTINECAKILKAGGAERVDFFTIARSQSS